MNHLKLCVRLVRARCEPDADEHIYSALIILIKISTYFRFNLFLHVMYRRCAAHVPFISQGSTIEPRAAALAHINLIYCYGSLASE